jgi:hypothetical protein
MTTCPAANARVIQEIASRASSGRQLMARMPRDNSGPRVPWPAPRTPLAKFLPFRGYRSVYRCLDSPPGTERS